MERAELDRWLGSYKNAWEGRDPQAAADLFSNDAEYWWTPLDPPALGPAGVAAAWEGAVSQQRDISFRYEILAVTERLGIASWRADFTSVPKGAQVCIEGILTVEFSAPQKCRVFREWWHSREEPPR